MRIKSELIHTLRLCAKSNNFRLKLPLRLSLGLHFATSLPNLLNFPPGFFWCNPDIFIKIFQAFVAADLHNELRWSACQELIGAKRPSAGMGSDPGIFRL